MKRIFTLLFASMFTIGLITAQDEERYLDEVFTDVDVNTVIYGVNGTVLALPVVGEVIPRPLPMDIYSPAGDTATNRPVVLVFHTGNFLPNVTNGQIPGTRIDSSVVEICTQLARRGYVAASCDYRLGWNPLAPTQPERALGLIQAAYRGLQDGRNAVRFMRFMADDFGIDPDRISVLGTGTGGYLVLGMVGLSQYEEILTTTNGPAKFILDVDQNGQPDIPMVIEELHGDINGEVLTVAPDSLFGLIPTSALGIPPGDTTNYVNLAGISNDIALSINIGGALGDISWLEDNTTPIIAIHNPADQFAPYDDAVLVVPTTRDPIVRVQGAQQIGAISNRPDGANSVFTADGVLFDDPTTMLAIQNAEITGHPYYEGVFPFIAEPNSLNLDEGIAIDWWDPNAPSGRQDTLGNDIPWNLLPHPLGGTFHEQGLFLNENMSAEKARGNIAQVFNYMLPRMCVALDLPCADNFMETSSTEELININAFSVYPNPVQDRLEISSDEHIIQQISITTMSGELMINVNDINNNQYTLVNDNLTSGIYLLSIRTENGVATQKVIFE